MEGCRQRRSSISDGVMTVCARNRNAIDSALSLKPLLCDLCKRGSHAQGGVNAWHMVESVRKKRMDTLPPAGKRHNTTCRLSRQWLWAQVHL